MPALSKPLTGAQLAHLGIVRRFVSSDAAAGDQSYGSGPPPTSRCAHADHASLSAGHCASFLIICRFL